MTDVASITDMIAALEAPGKVAVLAAPVGSKPIEDAFEQGRLRLLPVVGWTDGASLVKYPFMRQSRIAARSYNGQNFVVETLSSQVVLAGPAPSLAFGLSGWSDDSARCAAC